MQFKLGTINKAKSYNEVCLKVLFLLLFVFSIRFFIFVTDSVTIFIFNGKTHITIPMDVKTKVDVKKLTVF